MSEQKDTAYFPVFVDLSEKQIVVIGAGAIAARRIHTLLTFARKITVVAPEICDAILAMAGQGPIQLRRRPFEERDLDGADLVLVITNDKDLNRNIGSLCRERKIPVNVSHDKALCDFYFPGVIRKENLVVGVTASGKDHAQAKAVTEQIRNVLSEMEEEEERQ